MTKEEALDKMQRYCSYQDRCHKEVRSKLLSLRIYGDWLEEVMSQLIEEGYLNEERFALNYARGKFRMKGWGRLRIIRELKYRQISEYLIRKAIKEMEEEGGYTEALQKHLIKYYATRKSKYPIALLKKRLMAHGISKGFEVELVNQEVNSILYSSEKDL